MQTDWVKIPLKGIVNVIREIENVIKFPYRQLVTTGIYYLSSAKVGNTKSFAETMGFSMHQSIFNSGSL